MLFRCALVLLQALAAAAAPPASRAAPLERNYLYRVDRSFLRMRDGTRLAITWWRPTAKTRGEKFPVLLEYLPYRKEDSFYQRDFPLYDYFVRRGFIMAKVDIRGTGGSTGHLPPREYSDVELADADEIIRQLAAAPGSNGKVGMWGISWGGFNSLQVSMRHPPALKAILALHASDDLFHDDVRYIDGILHLDPYTLEIDHENGLPRTPDYPVDSAYLAERFNAYPWVLTYLKQPVDGPFWRKHEPRHDYAALTVPTYLIGGLLDGYRDTPIRALDRFPGTVKVEIGPWNHAWPDDGEPGPNYEWRSRAVRWWNHWLRGEDTGLLNEPRFLAFVRSGHAPGTDKTTTPGTWRFFDWPIPGLGTLRLYPGMDRKLSTAPGDSAIDRLAYHPGFGTRGGDWWGETTGDMRPDDAGSLVYDSEVLTDSLELVGTPVVQLLVSASAPQANWIARLEDVGPEGPVALVTGGAINGTLRDTSTAAHPLVPGTWYPLVFELHFTTWTFRPGHRIRLAVTNAQFPMLWPSPRAMTTSLAVGSKSTLVDLPIVPPSARNVPQLPPPEVRSHAPDARDRAQPEPPRNRIIHDELNGTTAVELFTSWAYTVGKRNITTTEHETWETTDSAPGRSRFLGEEWHRLESAGRRLDLRTRMEIRSDSASLHVTVTRRLERNGKPFRSRTWQETLPREAH
ncbi:MAG TPA: CocE/NonD family hydrolase [Gemmatimonadales bacterium]|nr:CocE/NonD family hydrolase [Gemmatimonadales bacterium]